jgi:taurine dioxygenase
VVSNIVEDGQHIGAHGGSKEYHSDLAYMAEPSLGSVFHCIECPKIGGEKAFVRMAAAYDALPEGLRQRLNGLDAIYDYGWSYGQRHATLRGPLSAAQRAKTPEVIHPAVPAHPETGRPALFLSDIWIKQFVGVNETDSQAMLKEAVAIAVRPDVEYRHAWGPGDIVIWDNRSTMHRACPFDDATERRLMHRTTISGDKPIRKMDAQRTVNYS